MKAATTRRLGAGSFRGTVQIVLYNWPFYLFGALACLFAVVLARVLAVPAALRVLMDGGGALAAFWLVGSLVASYWVYDHSDLCRWEWIRALLPVAPQRWANIHAGLDETSLALRSLFPATASTILDIYDPAEMTEPAIRRARRRTPPPVAADPADVAALPFKDEELDVAFLIFAAHEIRTAELRLRFFRELYRALKPGGRVVMVEHLRDPANFLAFGPGFLHFHSRREWRRLARESGFAMAQEFRFTPFVGVFMLERAQ